MRRRDIEGELWVDSFLADDSVKNPELSIRSAVKEFLSTEVGKKAVKETMHDFNWGDAVIYVPEKIWNKYGLKFMDVTNVNVPVCQDEVLCDTE